MKKWKVLNEKDVSPSKWFPITQQTIELPNGKVIDDYFISPMLPVVMIFPITTAGEVVLVKQYKHAIREIILELPAGFLQKDKSLEETALAELAEEIGVQTTIENLIPIGKTANSPTKTTQLTHYYIARNLTFNSQQNLDETEEIEIVLVTPGKLLDMVKSGEIFAVDTVAAVMKVKLLFPDVFA